MGERLVKITQVLDDDGTLFHREEFSVEKSKYDSYIQQLANTSLPNVVAFRVRKVGVKPFYLWINGEILTGDELNKRQARPFPLPRPERVVITRTASRYVIPPKSKDSTIFNQK